MLWIGGILKGHLSHCMWWILQDLLSFEPDPLPFLPKTHSLMFVLVGHQASNMASKLVRHSHLRALSSFISINNHIHSPHFSNPNPNRAPLSYTFFSNATSSFSTRGFQWASSLKDLELAKFASFAETWSNFLFPHFFLIPYLVDEGKKGKMKEITTWNFKLTCVMNMWDSKGPFKPLHVMNSTRLAFIRTRPVAIPTQNAFLVVCFGRSSSFKHGF